MRVAAVVFALVGVAGCAARPVRQDEATGRDGSSRGAERIELDDDGSAIARGIVTYPGGDRVDWKRIDIPKHFYGELALQLDYEPARPGVALALDVFDGDGRHLQRATGAGRTLATNLMYVEGSYLVRVYAPSRGDAARYVLHARLHWYDHCCAQQVDIPDPPLLPAVPPP